MKQSFARSLLIFSLILSLICFILSLIALHLPRWKTIQLRSTYQPLVTVDQHSMDPLIRSEVEKYVDVLYRRGETHSFGLSNHCLQTGQCGRNLLLKFDEANYGFCHNIHFHYQCIFSSTPPNLHNGKCTCEPPSYLNVSHKFLIILIFLQIVFFLVNLLRIGRLYCRKQCFNDIQLRLMSLISSLFSLLFLIIIIIQQTSHRSYEALEFFDAMRRHYSHVQIYTFSKDLEVIVQHMQNSFDIRLGASFFSMLIILIFTSIALITSISVEMKMSSASSSLTFNDDDDNKKIDQYSSHRHSSIEVTPNDRFIPSEHIRFTRQTKV